MTSVSRAGAASVRHPTLGHPAFWAALAVLVVNDHVLKGAGLVPAALTGKLSDFAGMIVAPWLAAAALGALRVRSTRARACAFAAIVLPFALTKVSPQLAGLLDATIGGLGLGWRTWSDPTDLIALSALPLTWHLSTPRAVHASLGALAIERSGLVLGAVACMATSRAPVDPFLTTTAWVLNRTGATITLRVHWARAATDCEFIEGRGVRAATREVFSEGTSFLLAPNASLGLADRLGASGEGGTFACKVVLLQADGLDDTVVAWSSLAPQTVPATLAEGDDGDPIGRVTLFRRDAELVPVPGTGVEVGTLAESVRPSLCPSATDASAEWSAFTAPFGRVYRVDTIDLGPDGCFGLRVTDVMARSMRSLFLCAPSSAVPFAPGANVTIEDTPDETNTGRMLRIAGLDGEPASRSSLTLFAGVERLSFRELSASIDPVECDGERQSCGALTLPALSTVTHPTVRTALHAGDVVAIDTPIGGLGTRSRLVYARGERVIFAPSACEPARAALGVHGDFVLMTYGNGGTP